MDGKGCPEAQRKERRFWVPALIVCFLAFLFYLGIQYISCKNLFMAKWGLCKVGSGDFEKQWLPKSALFKYKLLWMAPFLSGGGYGSEAISFATAIEASKLVPQFKIQQHGDLENYEFWSGLPQKIRRLLVRLAWRDFNVEETVVICHSEPGAWFPPLYQTFPCPPFGYEQPLYVIGRSMFETDRLNKEHVERCNAMDEVWVPTQFNIETFARSGVMESKLVKVRQTVDIEFFNPTQVHPLPLSFNWQVFGPSKNHSNFFSSKPYVFLSIFKWEVRKGWDILIKAFLQEFSAEDDVVLYLVTNAFHSSSNFDQDILSFVNKSKIIEPSLGWPTVQLCDHHVPQIDLPSLYKAADVFVLPSRGEGWGRPHIEAMAMALPVIATNWSGMTEYMTDMNSYPLPLDGMSEILEGPFKGHFWAEPSVNSLQGLMRHVYSHPVEAKARGLVARNDMKICSCF
ncbi:hypothetical protein O6H91_08G101300 [Diphasiastrum complanatum]|uniref:Uncharacterized protein n=1 Tax=Diphasiastrum complanatum TaxID=34168 RepID=A0ACC2D0N9_DIPCM|nr:hypothetical protein O6H91_08G101300 [Diphasiastrum complanatum]